MSRIKLKRLLTRQSQNRALIEQVDPNVCVEDAAGNVLQGGLADGERHPVQVGADVIGWVSGGERGETIARLLMQFAEQEIEKNELADQILDLYREVNLLYDLTNKLAVSPDIGVIADVIVAEVSRIITVGHTVVVLRAESERLRFLPTPHDSTLDEALVRPMLANDKAEIIDDLSADPRWSHAAGVIGSLAYAPLKAKGQVLGLIVLTNRQPTTYRAADLKILNSIAAQAAPVIDNALLYQRTTRDAAEREARLNQQIRDLRIEIDEKRQGEKVAEITDSDYFQAIREQKELLRQLLDNPAD